MDSAAHLLQLALSGNLACVECGWAGKAADCASAVDALFCPTCAGEVGHVMSREELLEYVVRRKASAPPGPNPSS